VPTAAIGIFGFCTLKGDLKQMTQWIRFDYQGKTAIGTLTGDTVSEYKGGLFDSPQPTGRSLPLSDVQLKAPLVPHSILALWNNFHERAQKESQTLPDRCLSLVINTYPLSHLF
jgi:hypothetical protein